MSRAPFEKGLQQITPSVYAYLQPDGSWGLSNAGLVVDGEATMLVDTPPAPMLPMRLFRGRPFNAANGLSFAMFFGAFGAIFLVSQYFQTAQGVGPFEAGARTLPWTAIAAGCRQKTGVSV